MSLIIQPAHASVSPGAAASGAADSEGTFGLTAVQNEPEDLGGELSDAIREVLAANMQKVISLFQQWDVDGDGKVSPKEFRVAIKALALPITDADVRLIFRTFDPDNDGTISFGELNKLLKQRPGGGGERERGKAPGAPAGGATAGKARGRRNTKPLRTEDPAAAEKFSARTMQRSASDASWDPVKQRLSVNQLKNSGLWNHTVPRSMERAAGRLVPSWDARGSKGLLQRPSAMLAREAQRQQQQSAPLPQGGDEELQPPPLLQSQSSSRRTLRSTLQPKGALHPTPLSPTPHTLSPPWPPHRLDRRPPSETPVPAPPPEHPPVRSAERQRAHRRLVAQRHDVGAF